MQSVIQTASVSKNRLWTGRIISGLVAVFLLADSVVKLMKLPVAVEGTTQLGYPESVVVGIEILLFVCTILYLMPQTSIIGAILLTGYLGGATATHVRVGADLFPILFPGILGMLVWLGIYLRDKRLSELVPLRG